MKRLLCIVSSMNAGGAETFLMKLYRQIDRTKYQMDFCVNIHEEGFYDKEIEALGGKIYRIPSKSENLHEFKKQLSNIIKSERYEYALRMCSNAMSFMDLKIAKDSGAKKCIARATNSKCAGRKAIIAHKIGKAIYSKYVDVRIAPSDLAAVFTFGEKVFANGEVVLLHNAINYDTYRYNQNLRRNIRNELGVHDDTMVVGHIGRFAKQKNHEFLLRVFSEICERKPNSTLLLVGAGELEPIIRKKIEEMGLCESVIFTGVRQDVPALLSAMDVFVFPSLYEGMPNTVIEAQASGLPCVLSDTISGEANITGLLSYLPLISPELWADKAISVISLEREDTKQYFVDNKYDIQTITDEFVSVIFK